MNTEIIEINEIKGNNKQDSFYVSRQEQARKEYERIKELVQNSDPTKIALLDGLIWEAAKTRTQLRELNELAYSTGPIRVSEEKVRNKTMIQTSISGSRIQHRHVQHTNVSTDFLCDSGPLRVNFRIISAKAI